MEAVRDMLHGEGYLSQTACERLLSEFGLPVARSQLVSSAEACRDISLRYPVVAKIEHPGVLHKSDVGGVVLNLSGPEALGRTVKELLLKFDGADGVRVQEQVGPGLELILGANSDPVLGHVLMVGLGGVGVELYRDVAVSHVPFDRAQARKMLQSLRCAPILRGYRGAKGVDVEGLIDLMGKVQQLLLRCPRIGELDLNPVIWDGTCFTVADCRIRVW
jgi:coA-binding domain protein